MKKPEQAPPGWGKRLMWLVFIWVCSTAALGVAAYAMRLVMRSVGMSN